MKNSYQMIAISSPEFINLQPHEINPAMTVCDIRICYIGANRNGSYFSKEVLSQMAKTLRGSPIVGKYNTETKDFTDHGEKLIVDENGLRVEYDTIPYGFVSPDARVWFQQFNEYDFNTQQTIEKEYLMTTGYLWVNQFSEINKALSTPKGQSMEINADTLKGKWAETIQGTDVFIVTNADFSKLCILGDDTEPCFEAAAILPKTAAIYDYKNISKNKEVDCFTRTLYSMMSELKNLLKEGGTNEMQEEKTIETEETPNTYSQESNFILDKDEDINEKDEKDDIIDGNREKDDDDDIDERSKEKKTYSSEADVTNDVRLRLLKQELEEANARCAILQNDLESLQIKCNELMTFQNQVMSERKDELINKFYSLSNEDKKDIIENKDKYTLDEIEAKLSIIYTRNALRQLEEDTRESTNKFTDTVMTFNVENQNGAVVPDFLNALRARKNR